MNVENDSMLGGDSLTLLLMLSEKMNSTDMQHAQLTIDDKSKQRLAAHDKEMKALLEKIKAETGPGFFESIAHAFGQFVEDLAKGDPVAAFEHLAANFKEMAESPSFMRELRDFALAIAQVASTIVAGCTFGAASPFAMALIVAGIVLQAAGFLEGNLDLLQKLGVDPDVAKWLRVGVSIAGSVCGVVGGLASGAKAVGDVANAAFLVSGSAYIVGGAASAGCAAWDYHGAQVDIDMKKCQQLQDFLQRLIDDVVQQMQDDHKQHEQDSRVMTGAIETESNMNLSSAQKV